MSERAGQPMALAEAEALADRWRRDGRTIVTTNGSFDLLHVGHVRYLQEAAAQGDCLIVGLNSDASVRANKGPTRPIVPEAQRAEMLLALRCVDAVVVFDAPTPLAFLRAVRPHVHVNGAEYGDDCVEAPLLAEWGARLHLVPRIEGLSSSALMERAARAAAGS
jgi:rfaE bifunctional protein nucleotidyltransferase chain/domain